MPRRKNKTKNLKVIEIAIIILIRFVHVSTHNISACVCVFFSTPTALPNMTQGKGL